MADSSDSGTGSKSGVKTPIRAMAPFPSELPLRGWRGAERCGSQDGRSNCSGPHEHLGQLIAYARTNKIVPPWSK
jgi:hypothetical protein